MKINQNIERYNISNLEEIVITIKNLKHINDTILEASKFARTKASLLGDSFTSINFERIMESLDLFVNRLTVNSEQLVELLGSVKELYERVYIAWKKS